MSRTWFSKGVGGVIASGIQSNLLKQGFFAGDHDKFLDGDFGQNTSAALLQLQAARSLAQTGSVDDDTWRQLTVEPVPTLFERCLGLTASFEGNGSTLIEGNFDGAGLTWGVIGFTLSNNEIQALLAEIEAAAPGTLVRVMGAALAQEWATRVALPLAAQVEWADSISTGAHKTGLPAEWVQAFARLGTEPLVQRVQMQHAYDKYFVPCTATAKSSSWIASWASRCASTCTCRTARRAWTAFATSSRPGSRPASRSGARRWRARSRRMSDPPTRPTSWRAR